MFATGNEQRSTMPVPRHSFAIWSKRSTWEQQASRRTAALADTSRNEAEIAKPGSGSERVLGHGGIALLHRADRNLAAGSQRSSRSDRKLLSGLYSLSQPCPPISLRFKPAAATTNRIRSQIVQRQRQPMPQAALTPNA